VVGRALRTSAKARRIAANIAKPPELLRKPVIRSVELIVQPDAHDIVGEMRERADVASCMKSRHRKAAERECREQR
jgi:hypothetical protein